MLRHSSQRHGNCINSIFGNTFHSNPATGNISTLQTAAHPSRAVQSSRLVSRHWPGDPGGHENCRHLQNRYPRDDAVESIVIGIGRMNEQKIIRRTRSLRHRLRNIDPSLFVNRRKQIERRQARSQRHRARPYQ